MKKYDKPLNDESIELRLWEYIDGISSPEEKTVIGQLLESDTEWRQKYGELLELSQLMQSVDLEHPSMRFTKNVMENIARLHIAPATRTYINKRIIWGLAAFFITMIVGFLVYGFGQVDWTAQGDSTSSLAIGKIDFSKFFNNAYVNVFMMINIVLGLFLLDRFLANKRKEYRGEIEG
jgi:hypothetical protein